MSITKVSISDELWEQTEPEHRRELVQALSEKADRANREEGSDDHTQ